MNDKKPNILLMMSGSIACAKATALISEWVKRGHGVRVACTPSVKNFLGRSTLEGLSGEPVFADTFEAGRAMDHIGLARWANVVVVCPATSGLINKLACGIADEAVSTLWQAAWGRGKPQFIVPAMNTRMWNYPATRESVSRLRAWGVHVLPTAEGDLACGEQGAGRMLEPEEILDTIDKLLAFDDLPGAGRRVLITGGGTREPIDAVRYIGNHSTGRTSASLAETFDKAGFSVTWLGAASAIEPGGNVRCEQYESFEDLREVLKRLLAAERFDMVIHAAAVSDFSVQSAQSQVHVQGEKLPSDSDLVLRLVPNPKLLTGLRGQSLNPDAMIVGFKLTAGADAERARTAVGRLFDQGGVDYVVHNELADINRKRHVFTLYARGEEGLAKPLESFGSPAELASGLSALLSRQENREPVS